MALDGAGLAPAFEDEVDVAAADAAVADLEEDVVGSDLGDRPFLDVELALLAVDGDAHGVGNRGHVGPVAWCGWIVARSEGTDRHRNRVIWTAP